MNFIKRFIEISRENRRRMTLKYMTAEQAFSYTTIGKLSNADDVFEEFLTTIIENIKALIDPSSTKCIFDTIVDYKDYLNDEYKKLFIDRMEELGYQILYHDDNICLISWRYKGHPHERALGSVQNTEKVNKQILKG